MIGLNMPNGDSPGLGETELRNSLVIGIGQGATDQFFSTWEANVVTADDVAEWASWGVNTVRLPMNYHSLSTADGAYVEAGFQVLDSFIGWCKSKGIYVILDLHAAPGAQNCEEMSDTPDGVAHLWADPKTYRQWTIDLWQTIARRYANETAVMGFDLFDEPYDDENTGSFDEGVATTLLPMYQDLTRAIRAVDAHHVLFFEGTNWSAIDASGSPNGFAGLEGAVQADPQTAWSFHEYVSLDNNNNLTKSQLNRYLSLRTTTGRPVWHGETGEHDYAWLANTISLDEANKIGWNMWTYKKANDMGQDYDPSGLDPTQAYSVNESTGFSALLTFLQSCGIATNACSKRAASTAAATAAAFAANAATPACRYNSGWVHAVWNK
jgi:aryl-phospho-beta-D-glucosidase BglC (GH1 family)